MTKVLVLYYWLWPHRDDGLRRRRRRARAGRRGRGQAGARAGSGRIAKQSHFKLDQPAPIAEPDELADTTPSSSARRTRFGTMTAQMRNFWDQTGGLWMKGALVGKVGSVVRLDGHPARRPGNHIIGLHPHPAAPGHGRRRPALRLPGRRWARRDRRRLALRRHHHRRRPGQRQPSEQELAGARFQGKHVAEIAKKLKG